MSSPVPRLSLRKTILSSICLSFLSAALPAASDAQQVIQGHNIFPANSIYNKDISGLSVHANSDNFVNTLGRTRAFHPDWGTNPAYGIPYQIVDVAPGTPDTPITFTYADESDVGPYPVNKKTSLIEGGTWKKAKNKGDRHVIMVDPTHDRLYELYSTYPKGAKKIKAGSGAIFDMSSNALRPEGWTSADAAGLPIFPLLLNYDELLTGQIKHAFRLTCSTTNGHIWPARHSAGSNAAYPPMGARFRMKAGFDISGFSAKNQVILTAMKKYGMFVADNGSNWYVQAAPDPRWNDDELNELKTITGDAFEMVDESGLMVDADSGQSN